MFSFDKGVQRGRTVWKAKGIGIGDPSRYRPNVLFGDVEGNGHNSIVVIQHSIIWVVDVATGFAKWEAVGPTMRNYGFAGLFDTDLDGQLELVLVNDAVQQHIAVVKLTDDQFEYVWNKDLGYSEHDMKTPYFPVRDIDGDGKLEIIYSIGELDSRAWEVQILSADNGPVKYKIPDARLLDFGNQDHEGNVELLLEDIASSDFVVRKLQAVNTELYRTHQSIQAFISAPLPPHCNHVAHDRMEVYFHDPDQDGQLKLTIIDQGKVLWSKPLKGDFIGGWVKDCTWGKFLSADSCDIFANVSSGPTYINECMMIRTSDGEIIWRRSDGHDSGMGPVDGRTSVRSMEEDGLDDLLFLSGDMLTGIDGATGHNLMSMKSLSEVLGTRWLGSGPFTLIDVDDDGQLEIVMATNDGRLVIVK